MAILLPIAGFSEWSPTWTPHVWAMFSGPDNVVLVHAAILVSVKIFVAPALVHADADVAAPELVTSTPLAVVQEFLDTVPVCNKLRVTLKI